MKDNLQSDDIETHEELKAAYGIMYHRCDYVIKQSKKFEKIANDLKEYGIEMRGTTSMIVDMNKFHAHLWAKD